MQDQPRPAWLPRLGCEVILLPIALFRAHRDPDVLHGMYTWYAYMVCIHELFSMYAM